MDTVKIVTEHGDRNITKRHDGSMFCPECWSDNTGWKTNYRRGKVEFWCNRCGCKWHVPYISKMLECQQTEGDKK